MRVPKHTFNYSCKSCNVALMDYACEYNKILIRAEQATAKARVTSDRVPGHHNPRKAHPIQRPYSLKFHPYFRIFCHFHSHSSAYMCERDGQNPMRTDKVLRSRALGTNYIRAIAIEKAMVPFNLNGFIEIGADSTYYRAYHT